MKRAWRGTIVVGLLAGALGAGCGGYGSDAVRLTGWLTSPAEERLMQAMVDSFEAVHPGVDVHYEPIGANYMDKLQLMLGTGTAPDLFYLEAFWAPSLVSFDVLMPLDSFIARDPSFDLDDFEPALLDAFRFEGRLYGLPKDYSTLVLYYNPELFAAAGLTRPPRDWEEFRGYARRLTRDVDGDGRVDQYGFSHAETLEYLLPFVWQNGGDYFDEQGRVAFTDSAFVEALRFVEGMLDEGSAVLPADIGAAWNMDAFGRGRVAMAFSGLWAVHFMEETFADVPYRVAELPAGEQAAGIAFVVGFAMPKSTHHPEAAWRLLRHLTGPAGQSAWARAGIGLPPRRSVVERLGMYDDPIRGTLIRSAAVARPWQLGANNRVYDESQSILQAIYMTDAPIDASLKRLRTRIARE